jgi:hypothetical protein
MSMLEIITHRLSGQRSPVVVRLARQKQRRRLPLVVQDATDEVPERKLGPQHLPEEQTCVARLVNQANIFSV